MVGTPGSLGLTQTLSYGILLFFVPFTLPYPIPLFRVAPFFNGDNGGISSVNFLTGSFELICQRFDQR
jgi:hypothetical protein